MERTEVLRVKRIENSVFKSNTFIISHPHYKEWWLVDIGDIQPLMNLLEEDCMIKGLLITHTHYDHIYGINQLVARFPECEIYTSISGKEGLASDKLNFSRYHGDIIRFISDSVKILNNEDKLELYPGVFIEVLETSGHDKSCLSYFTDKLFFSGDSFIPGVKVIDTFPNSNKKDAQKAEKDIKEKAFKHYLYPGHGEEIFFEGL